MKFLQAFLFPILMFLLTSCIAPKEFTIGDKALQAGNYDMAVSNLSKVAQNKPDNSKYQAKYSSALSLRAAAKLDFLIKNISTSDNLQKVKELKSAYKTIQEDLTKSDVILNSINDEQRKKLKEINVLELINNNRNNFNTSKPYNNQIQKLEEKLTKEAENIYGDYKKLKSKNEWNNSFLKIKEAKSINPFNEKYNNEYKIIQNYKDGFKFLENKSYEEAFSNFKNIIDINHNENIALQKIDELSILLSTKYINLAETNIENENFQDAINNFNKVIKYDKSKELEIINYINSAKNGLAQNFYEMADNYMQENKYDKAIAYYQKSLATVDSYKDAKEKIKEAYKKTPEGLTKFYSKEIQKFKNIARLDNFKLEGPIKFIKKEGYIFLSIDLSYNSLYYGWNTNEDSRRRGIEEGFLIPTSQILASIFSGPEGFYGYNINVKVTRVEDKQQLFNEQFYYKTGKRVGPFPAPRLNENFNYYISGKAANLFTKARISESELRQRMSILLDNSKIINFYSLGSDLS